MRTEGPRPAGEALATVADRLAEPRPDGQLPYVIVTPFMPDLETEIVAHSVRLRGIEAAALYRHALAITRGEWPKHTKARVLVRAADGLHAFDARWIEARAAASQQIAEIRCCRRCGCTQDRACRGGCAWRDRNLCTACVESGE